MRLAIFKALGRVVNFVLMYFFWLALKKLQVPVSIGSWLFLYLNFENHTLVIQWKI